MSLSVRGLGGASLAYSLGGFAGKVLAIATAPLLARLLGPAELGLLDTIAVAASLVGVLAIVGTDQGLARYQADDDGHIWSAGLLVAGAFGIVAAVAGIAVHAAGGASPVALGLVYGGTLAWYGTGMNVVRLRARPAVYAALGFSALLVQSIGAVLIAFALAEPVQAIVLLWAAVSVAVGVIAGLRYRPRLSRPGIVTFRLLLAFGIPLVPAAIAWVVGDLAVRAQLAAGAGLAEVGGYGLALRLASVLGIITAGFGLAWLPRLSRANPDDEGGQVTRALLVLLSVLSSLAVLLAAIAPELIAILGGPGYADAAALVAPLAAGQVAYGMFIFFAGLSGRRLRTRSIAGASVIGAGTQAVLAVALVPLVGSTGAGLAVLGGFTAGLIAMIWSSGGLRFPPGTKRSLVALCSLAALALAVMWTLVLAEAAVTWRIGLAAVGAGMIALTGLRPHRTPAIDR